MKFLASSLSVLRARWFWSLVGAIILSLLIWFYGDIIGVSEAHPLTTPVSRLLVVLGITIVWGLWNVLAQARAKSTNAKLVTALAEPPRGQAPASAELAELERRFAGALDQLKRSRLGKQGSRRWLYELPWYVMIGPPGSGKSTALAQSGLRLLTGQIKELRGVGGPRHCAWVLSDEAVLIDTAGRYTTQDSDPGADKAAWLGFLDLLKERRPRYPLNGIMVALATRDLLQDGGADHAAPIRIRLEEIETRLGMRLPVYLLITKADLIAGFEPFFDTLNETDREQVWGYTFDYRPGEERSDRETSFDPAEFRAAWAELVARLDRRLPARMAAEPDVGRRSQIFSFPAQVASIGEEIIRFVPRCFQASSYERGGWLRGIYLTSGTQTGTQIDRLMVAVGQTIGAKFAPPVAVAGDRSFFLRRLLEGVIFSEAAVAGRDLARERRDSWWRAGAVACVVSAAIVVIAGWGWSYTGNSDRYTRIQTELSRWAQDAQPFAQARLTESDADFVPILPLLDRLDAIRSSLQRSDPVDLQLGLSQRSTIATEVNAAYRSALTKLFLPRLFLTAQRDLRKPIKDPDYIAFGLKVYVALTGGATAGADLMQRWFALDLQSRPNEVVASVQHHIAALALILPELDSRVLPQIDKTLVGQLRLVFDQNRLPKHAYDMLLSNAAAAGLDGWKITGHAGPNASTALVRRSGRPLDYPIPANFTYDGFYRIFLPQLDSAARGTYAEYWILTDRGTPEATTGQIDKIKADMLALYYTDAIAAWEGLLHDVAISPITNPDQAVEITKALSGPSSPLKLLIQSVVHETSLTVQPDPAHADTTNPALKALDAAKLDPNLMRLANLVLPGSAAAAPAEIPGAPVEAHFAYLRQLVQGVNGAPPAIDEAVTILGVLSAKLGEAVASPNRDEALGKISDSATSQLALVAQSLPDPLKQMLQGVERTTKTINKTSALKQLNAVWQTDVLPFCRTAIGDRFPFVPTSSMDATMDDVSRVFGPGGLIDGFVKDHLAGFVDMTRKPWRDSQNIGLSSASLAQLDRAHRIGIALFPAGASPKVSFMVNPFHLDSHAESALLDVDGQQLHVGHGPSQWVKLTWPAPAGTSTMRVSFVPLDGSPPVMDENDGPWALFRLLYKRNVQPTDQPEVFNAEIGAGNYLLVLKLRASSVANPFEPGLLSGFTCPEAL